MVRLYIETNFLMSIAMGRDEQAYNLLQSPPLSVRIVIPDICCMEALSALDSELKRRNSFENELNFQVGQLRRDLTSVSAQSLLNYLEQSLNENESLRSDIKNRFFQTIAQVTSQVELIFLTSTLLQESHNTILIADDLTDNLILHCIIHDARQYPDEVKVFLSSNIKDFNVPEVQRYLNDAGITRYFSRTQNFLGWLNAQSTL